MINSLDYTVTFPSTGRTLSGQYDFQTGFGAIVGPNESGKSFIIEMIRWLLFGTAALRGTGEDYKKLRGALQFTVKNQTYVVARGISSATLKQGDVDLAIGIRAVNDKVVSILGFGLSVFDVACVANQDDLQALGNMKPAERKRMVDSVIGLGVIEDLAKWAGEEALSLQREADAIKRVLVEPTLPTTPVGYRPSTELEPVVSHLTQLKYQLYQVIGWLTNVRQAPVAPTCLIVMAAADLGPLAAQQRKDQDELRFLYSLPMVEGEVGDHDAYDRWTAKQSFLRRHPEPPMTEEYLLERHYDYDLCQSFKQRTVAQHHRDHMLAHGNHTCPSCDHQWPVEAERLADAEEKLASFAWLDDRVLPKVEPDLVKLHQAHRLLQDWNANAAEWETLRDAVEVAKPRFTREQVAASAQRAAIPALEAKLAVMIDYEAAYHTRRLYEMALAAYQVDTATYREWLAERAAKKEEEARLRAETANEEHLRHLLADCKAFEQQMAAYGTHHTKWQAASAEAETLAVGAERWRAAKVALATLRGLVKQHLVPSLNKVASNLISLMTGGQRTSIVIDEEFNILVDNQALNTLSGSGKAVANLAIRLGLGQVLTNNMMSLFMGDEIDASMDKDRAENTANTLQTLRNRISQILLVTHKLPSADYYIELRNISEPQQDS